MSTTGIKGIYRETRDYTKAAAFWGALGYAPVFETGHSGQWVHPAGGPYVFINEQTDPSAPLDHHPILGVADGRAFEADDAIEIVKAFRNEHWGEAQALIRDGDGGLHALQAPAMPD